MAAADDSFADRCRYSSAACPDAACPFSASKAAFKPRGIRVLIGKVLAVLTGSLFDATRRTIQFVAQVRRFVIQATFQSLISVVLSCEGRRERYARVND